MPLQSITAAVNRELPCCCWGLLLIPRILLARGKANIQVSRPQSNSHCASGVSAGSLLVKGSLPPSLQVPIERPQRVPVPDCGASHRLRALLKWPKPLKRGTLYPRGLESQTSLHRFAVSVQARLPALPPWRPLACGHLPGWRLGPFPTSRERDPRFASQLFPLAV